MAQASALAARAARSCDWNASMRPRISGRKVSVAQAQSTVA